MLVGEPAFAVQLQTIDGRVLTFDDPGCYFSLVAKDRPEPHAVYFHDSTSDRWLLPAEVGFVDSATTPMGFGLAAVPATTAGALSLDEARARVLSTGESPAGGRT
jgi:hypothetical protein